MDNFSEDKNSVKLLSNLLPKELEKIKSQYFKTTQKEQCCSEDTPRRPEFFIPNFSINWKTVNWCGLDLIKSFELIEKYWVFGQI